MKRHSLSVLVSLLLHTILLAMLFFSYKYLYPILNAPKENIVCINLSCMKSSDNSKIVTKETPKKEKKVVKKASENIPKIQEEVVKKKREKKKTVAVKKAPIKKVVETIKETKVENKAKAKAEIVVKPALANKSKSTPQNSVKISLPQKSEQTDEEIYVEENLNLIVQLLQENLYYPRRARKRGVEGDVLVRFKLSKEAEVTNVEVLLSKSDILSRGALRTIENIASKLPKPKENLTLSVPISYRLR